MANERFVGNSMLSPALPAVKEFGKSVNISRSYRH